MANELNVKSATGTFEYDRTLQSNWIRLVDIQTGSGMDPLLCTLSADNLENSVEPF